MSKDKHRENHSKAEWINTNEVEQCRYSLNVEVTFTRNITQEEAVHILMQIITRSAENLIINDPNHIFPHLQSVTIK